MMYTKKPKGQKNSARAQRRATTLYLEPNQFTKSNIDKEQSPMHTLKQKKKDTRRNV